MKKLSLKNLNISGEDMLSTNEKRKVLGGNGVHPSICADETPGYEWCLCNGWIFCVTIGTNCHNFRECLV